MVEIVGVMEDTTVDLSALVPELKVGIEHRLPFAVVGNIVTDQNMNHDETPLSEVSGRTTRSKQLTYVTLTSVRSRVARAPKLSPWPTSARSTAIGIQPLVRRSTTQSFAPR